MYITVEGPVGAGKTTLTKILAEELNYNDIYEIVDENPFLEKYYQDIDRWAFQTEMFFLTSRYDQLCLLQKKIKSGNQNIVADYNITKNLIFAKKSLKQEDYQKLQGIYKILTTDLKKADLIIILKADLETLKKRIIKRARSYEQDTEKEYWLYLIDAYNDMIRHMESEGSKNYLVIDCAKYDYVENKDDYDDILKLIKNKIKKINKENYE